MNSPAAHAVSKLNLLVLIPAYNESLNIETVLRELEFHGYNSLVINDGSTDDTSTRAKQFRIPVLDLPYNLGVGGALRAGFQYAVRNGFEAIVQIDADGQHPIGHIEDLIRATNDTDAHLVLGSRFLGLTKSMELGTIRRLTMKVLARSASKATGTRITDSTSGFRLIRNPLLEKFSINFASNYLGDTYEALIAAGRSGYRVHEIPAPITDRLNGVSSSSSLKSTGQTLKVLTVALLKLHTKI
jgi:glycosyltransferase involved in cell wall biosynthesis